MSVGGVAGSMSCSHTGGLPGWQSLANLLVNLRVYPQGFYPGGKIPPVKTYFRSILSRIFTATDSRSCRSGHALHKASRPGSTYRPLLVSLSCIVGLVSLLTLTCQRSALFSELVLSPLKYTTDLR